MDYYKYDEEEFKDKVEQYASTFAEEQKAQEEAKHTLGIDKKQARRGADYDGGNRGPSPRRKGRVVAGSAAMSGVTSP